MTQIALNDWCSITAQSGMPLYAVLSNVSDAETIKNYYLTDGSQTPFGLYTGTPYSNWQAVMPMLVQLNEHSNFLDWIHQTKYNDWGWLARSHLPLTKICAHLRSLTQVVLPDGETVFFRYWDGVYLTHQIRFMAENWANILPAFAFYWINRESFTVYVPIERIPKVSPWWQVPQELLDHLSETNPELLVNDVLQLLQENFYNIYASYPYPILKSKIIHLLSLSQKNKSTFDFILKQLQQEKSYE